MKINKLTVELDDGGTVDFMLNKSGGLTIIDHTKKGEIPSELLKNSKIINFILKSEL